MAGVVLRLEDEQLRGALRAIQRALGDTEPLMAEIGEIVITQTKDSFDRGESPAGEPWEPSQRVLKHGGRTLVSGVGGGLSGTLEREVYPDQVIVGSSVAYAAIHQFGGRAGRGHAVDMPARPFLPDETNLDLAEIQAAIEAHFAAALR